MAMNVWGRYTAYLKAESSQQVFLMLWFVEEEEEEGTKPVESVTASPYLLSVTTYLSICT